MIRLLKPVLAVVLSLGLWGVLISAVMALVHLWRN